MMFPNPICHTETNDAFSLRNATSGQGKNSQWACKKTAKTDIYDKHCRILLSGMPVMLVSPCWCNMEESKTFSSCRVPGQKSREQANWLRKISELYNLLFIHFLKLS